MPLFLEDRTLFDAELLNNLFLQQCPYMVFKILIDDENKTYTDFELKLKLTFYNYHFCKVPLVCQMHPKMLFYLKT